MGLGWTADPRRGGATAGHVPIGGAVAAAGATADDEVIGGRRGDRTTTCDALA